MKTAFVCDYCPDYDRSILTEEEAIAHEKICIWNPQSKHCLTCKDLGMVEYQDVYTSGKPFLNSTRGCISMHRPVNSGMISNCKFHKEERNLNNE